MIFRVRRVPKPLDWLVRAIGVFLVVAAGIVALASTRWFRNVLEHHIESSLQEITGGTVEIAGMGFRPLQLRVSARRVVIHGREKDPATPLFAARDVVAEIDPVSLFHMELRLRALAWQQAALHVQMDPSGSTNLPEPQVPARGQGFADLLDMGIHRLTLSHTTVTWNNRRIPLEVAARDLAIHLRRRDDQHYLGTLSSTNIVLDWESKLLPSISFATSFELSANHAQISSLSWQIKNLRGHSSISFRWAPQFEADFHFRANGGLQELAEALQIPALRRGYLYLEGEGAYTEAGLTVRGRSQVRELVLKTPQFHPGLLSFATDYAFEKGKLKLTRFTLAGLEGRAEGEAALSFPKGQPRLALQSRVTNLSLAALIHSIPAARDTIGIFRPQASVDGALAASWRGFSRNLQGQFKFQFHAPQPSAASGLPLKGSVQGSLNLGRQSVITLADAQILTAHSTVDAHGAFGSPQSSLAVSVATTDFDEWRPLARILIETRRPLSLVFRNVVTFSGSVSGTFSHPEIRGRLITGAFDYGGWRWDGFRADLLGASDHTQVSSGRLKLGASTLTLDASADLDHWELRSDCHLHLKAAAQKTPIAGLRAALGLKLSMKGLVTGQLQADGTLRDLSGEGAFAVQKGEFAGVPFDLLSAQVRASASAWTVHNLQLTEGRGRTSGALQFDLLHRSFSAELHGRNYPLDQLHLFKRQGARAESAGPLSGLVSFDVNGEGSFDNARASSTLDLTGLAWKGQSLGSFHGRADWEGRQIRLDFRGGGELAGKIRLNGAIETHNAWSMTLAAQYSNFRIDPWVEQFSGRTMGAQISTSGAFTITGPFRQASQWTGMGQARRLEISFGSLRMINEKPFEIHYAGRQLTLDRFRMQGPETSFEAGGSIHFGEPPSVDFTAKGRAAANLLSMMAGQIQATGESDLQVHVQGSLVAPQMEGWVAINDVSLGYGNLPIRVSSLQGMIKLEHERAVISSLKGIIGGGTVNLTGYLALLDVPRYEIRGRLSQVRVRFPSDFTSVSDGNLTLSGTPAGGHLSGDVTIRNVFASENLNLVDLVSGAAGLATSPTVEKAPTFASNLNLNVRVSSARPVRIETHNVRLVADINLRLQGTVADPVVVGNLHLRSGDAVFRGNRYTLARGEVSMTNPFQTEPILDLQARTRVNQYDLTLEISGPVDRLRFAYRSDPPLPAEDILSLLAFGYSRRQNEYAPTARNNFSSTGASALLSQALSSQVSGRIQRLFGVSRIKYSPYSANPATLGSPVLTVEQQLSPDLTLTYETSTANSQYRVIQFDWNVSQRMAVRGFRDQNGIFGLELRFRRRFR